MLVTCLSWIIIWFVFWALGTVSARIIDFIFGYKIRRFPSVIMAGLVVATTYAELFSVFYRVSMAAVLLLIVICLIGVIFARTSIRNRIHMQLFRFREQKTLYFTKSAIAISLIVLSLYLVSNTPVEFNYPTGYDNYNYHAPSIRWLEEFGAVKGLGNLHSRFAYNSSFLCLQALFSFSWCYKMSLHSLNGLIWAFMTATTINGLFIFNMKKFRLSDLLRIIFLLILFRYDEMRMTAGPNTDFFPMCLTAYIFIEWCSLVEMKENCPVPYGLLALLGLFSASVKLSAGSLFIFSLAPIGQFIRKKQLKEIVKFSILGVILILPFILRNIIISGYVFYPAASLDFFDFDWEMPKSVVVSDSIIIKLYARAWGTGFAYSDCLRSFPEWVKIWICKAADGFDVLLLLDFILCIPVLIFVAVEQKKDYSQPYALTLPVLSVVGFLFLVFTAPSVRFGRWWFYCLPAVTVYYIFGPDWKIEPKPEVAVTGKGRRIICAGILFVAIIFSFQLFCIIKDGHNEHIVEPYDYKMVGTTGQYYELNGYKFYYYYPNPNGTNNLNGYDGYPGTETLSTLSRIEMRENTLSGGFRSKETSRSIPYDFQGFILPEELIKPMGLDKYYDTSSQYNTGVYSFDPSGYETLIDAPAYQWWIDRINVEEAGSEHTKAYTEISGWFLKQGVDSAGVDLQIVIKKDDDYFAVPTALVQRPDVTQYFYERHSDNHNYDSSGFRARFLTQELELDERAEIYAAYSINGEKTVMVRLN